MTEEEYDYIDIEREMGAMYNAEEESIASMWNQLKQDVSPEVYRDIREFEEHDCTMLYYYGLVNSDQISGTKQDSDFDWCNHEYVDQLVGISEDGYYGCIYLPYQDSYIKLSFSM